MSGWRGPARPLLLLLGTAAALFAASRALRRIDAVEVEGASMAPSLLPGDRLLVESWTYARRAPRAGEVVLVTDPRSPSRELIKRVAAVDGRHLDLRGDAPASSTDSRHFGRLPVAAVRWRVALRYWPPRRFGGLPAARPSEPLDLEPLGGEPACTAFEALIAGGEQG
ncbi:MAG TPA: nickel-type superoxide dismutase maturation protease [candidate division Zixibacteria bacterium]|nr:nickel-type superoxide dismutase maturation protease [candidate division Zixibacteria bacterium]